MQSAIVRGFETFVEYFGEAVFYPVFHIPLVVWVLVLGAVFFTLRMGFINIRGFAHAVQITRGKYDDPDDPGEIPHFQALTSALSATVGLGNIGGVAVAVGSGGPGAVFWMMIFGFFGMSAKFVEVTLAQTYRKVDADGVVSGGPMYYLSSGLAEKGLGKVGKVAAFVFAVCIIGGSFGGGNMFQANQSYELVARQIPIFDQYPALYGLILALIVGAVIVGGIKRIGAATSKIVPFMAVLYVTASLVIIIMHIGHLPGVISSILDQAFGSDAIFGGTLGALIIGMRRAVFSNEAGQGSAPIAHSAAKTDYPVREGFVALLEPFIDTIVICFMTASVLLITADENRPLTEMRAAMADVRDAEVLVVSAREAGDEAALATAETRLEAAEADYKVKEKGAQLTSAAFRTVFSWFPYVLALVVFLFAYSTMISWSYYGEKGWAYLFGRRSLIIYRLLFVSAIVLGSVAHLDTVLDFSDSMVFLCAFPNVIGCVLLSGKVRSQLTDYLAKLKRGDFDR